MVEKVLTILFMLAKDVFMTALGVLALTILLRGLWLKRFVEAAKSDEVKIKRRRMGLAAIVAIDVVVAYFALQSHLVISREGFPGPFQVIGKPLDCPFDAQGGIYKAESWVGEPHRRVICQRRGLMYLALRSTNDLAGHVGIRNAAEALSYVRLATSLQATYTSFSSGEFEVMAVEEVNKQLEYGDSSWSWMMNYPGGKLGLVSKMWLDSKRIPKATVSELPGGWRVSRICIRERKDYKYETVKVIEDVGSDGSYAKSEEPVYFEPPYGGWDGPDMDD